MNPNIKSKKLLKLSGIENIKSKKQKKKIRKFTYCKKDGNFVKCKSEKISVAKIVKIKYIFPQKRKKC